MNKAERIKLTKMENLLAALKNLDVEGELSTIVESFKKNKKLTDKTLKLRCIKEKQMQGGTKR